MTPEGHYFVVRGRLGRISDSPLGEGTAAALVGDLIAAWCDTMVAKPTGDDDAAGEACRRVDRAKRAVGERGPVRWGHWLPDLDRHMVRNTGYSAWFEALLIERRRASSAGPACQVQ